TRNTVATVSYQLPRRSGKWPVISADQWGLADQIQEPRREAIGCYEKWVGPTTRNEWRPGWLLSFCFVVAAESRRNRSATLHRRKSLALSEAKKGNAVNPNGP